MTENLSALSKFLKAIGFREVAILLLCVLVLILYLDRNTLYSFLDKEIYTKVVASCRYAMYDDTEAVVFYRLPTSGVFDYALAAYGDVYDDIPLTLERECAKLEEWVNTHPNIFDISIDE